MTSYFLSPQLSQRLIEKGVVSTFTFWHDKHSYSGVVFANDPIEYLGEVCTPAIHLFDLLLPQNAKKVWGINHIFKNDWCTTCNQHNDYGYAMVDCWERNTQELLSLLQSNGDLEGYIESTMV